MLTTICNIVGLLIRQTEAPEEVPIWQKNGIKGQLVVALSIFTLIVFLLITPFCEQPPPPLHFMVR